jgi:hypothetical protein
MLKVETLQGTAIPSSRLGRHESFCSDLSFQKVGKVGISPKRRWEIGAPSGICSNCLCGPKPDSNSRITVNYGVNSLDLLESDLNAFEDYASYVGKED